MNGRLLRQQERHLRTLQAVALLCAAALTVLAACGSSPQTIPDTGAGADTNTATDTDTDTSTGTDADTNTDDESNVDTNADTKDDSDTSIDIADDESNVDTNADTKDDSDTSIGDDTGFDIDIGDNTTWQEVFDTLAASEQSCIQDELGDALHELVMKRPVMVVGYAAGEESSIFPCLDPDTARGLFLSMLEAGFAGEVLGVEVELGQDERQCLREWVADIDVASVFAANEGDNALGTASFGIVACAPDPFIQAIAADMGVDGVGLDLDALSDDERECLREWVADIDPALLATEDDGTVGAAVFGIFACVPDLLIAAVAAGIGVDIGELSDDERECVREWANSLDEDDMMVMFTQQDDARAAVLGLRLISCVPDLFFQSTADADEYAGPTPPPAVPEEQLTPVWLPTGCITNADAVSAEDDHANGIEGATLITVGEAAEGAIDYDVDFDFFVFEAEAGESYQIDVAPGTMWDPVVSLCDGEEDLEHSDDYDGLAPRIYWEASSAGPYFVRVAGWDEGTYTLTVEVQ